MLLISAKQKWVTQGLAGLLMLCIASFALTENLLLLAVPFVALVLWFFINDWKGVWWLLLFSIPLSIQIWFLNDTLSTSVPDEPLTWMFFLLGIIVLSWKPTLLPQWWWRSPLVMVVALQFLWTFVTVLYSQELFYSIKFFAAKSWMVMCFFVLPLFVFRTRRDYIKAALLLLIPTVATAVVIMARHGLLYKFKFWKVEFAIGQLYYNHVDYSTFISMVFPVLLGAWWLTPRRMKMLRLILVGVIIFYLAAVYLSYARAAVLAVLFSLFIMVMIRMRLANWVMPAFYACSIALISYFATGDNYMDLRPNYEKTYMREHFIDHIKATFKGKDLSSMERLYRWMAGARMSTAHPIVGHGPNSFYYYYKPYAVTTFRTYVSRNPEGSTSHNYFLYMLTEQGWPALILYGVLIFVFFSQAQRTYHRFKDRFYKAATLIVAMIMAACFVNNFFSELIETHKIGALFFLSISLMVLLTEKSKQHVVLEQNALQN